MFIMLSFCIKKMLCLPTFFKSFFVFFGSILNFLSLHLVHFLIGLFLVFYFCGIANGVFSSIISSNWLLFVHVKYTDFCISLPWWVFLLFILSFQPIILAFPNTSSTKRDGFITSFPINSPQFFFICIIVLTSTSNKILINSGKSEHQLSCSWF